MCAVIAFDADDTLWHNETLFTMTQERFRRLLEPYLEHDRTGQALYETEMRNLHYFGYGIKGFTLSMIETAIELTDGRIPARDLQSIIDFAKAMITAPVQLIEHVAEVIPRLAQTYPLMLITKGDLFDQEAKIAQSGLADYFSYIEIVRDKTLEIYQNLLAKHRIAPAEFVMIGNSLRSDILPVVALGGHAIYIPYHLTWAHETINPTEPVQYSELEHIGRLPGLIERICDQGSGIGGQGPGVGD